MFDATNYNITLNVPYGTNIKNLIPSITTSPNATVVPATNVSQNFTSPVTYMVIAQDGSSQTYEVKVVVGAPPEVAKKSSQSGFIILIIIALIGIIIASGVVIILFIRRKNKQIK